MTDTSTETKPLDAETINDMCKLFDAEAEALGWPRHVYSDQLRALAAERDALQSENVKISASNRIWKAVCKTHEQSIAAHADAIAKAVAEEREKWVKVVVECRDEIDSYIRLEYPSDHPVHQGYRQRDYEANPARIALSAICTEGE